MADYLNRTLVCSILFIDMVGYSRKDGDEQVRLKGAFNAILGRALDQVPPGKRIVVDTGDGAAITFLENPEAALFAALVLLDHFADVPVRMGVNLGPVTVMEDVNGRDNVVGDGINVAQRVMGFARQGQLLVSRSFYDMVSLLSREYAELFTEEAPRTDKHDRAHDLYAVSEAVRVGRRVAQTQIRRALERRSVPVAPDTAPPEMFDAGTHYVVSGYSELAVREVIDKLVEGGHKLLSAVVQVGSKWLASVDNPQLAVQASVETFGFKQVICAPTREAVQLKVDELRERGATLVQEPESDGEGWTAVCEKTPSYH